MGGIGNFTFLSGDPDPAKVFSTDTGPCNTMMDTYMQKHFPGKYFDEDGAVARQGTINDSLLKALMNHSFFDQPFPKTTGPELFNLEYLSGAMQKAGLSIWSLSNEMLVCQVVQLGWVVAIGLYFGIQPLIFALASALVGVLLLETVNYIEHYGLRRRLLASGRPEPVLPIHSWNSDHELGRIFLYELTRHSDHHYKATRKYQVLRHMDESPQLPLGYPGSMLASLVPPLWFGLMDKRVQDARSKLVTQ